MGGDCPGHSAGIDGADESAGNGPAFSSGPHAAWPSSWTGYGSQYPGVLEGWGPGRPLLGGEAGQEAYSGPAC